MPSLVVIGQQIKEKRRGHNFPPPPAYMVPKYPRLNRVNRLDLRAPIIKNFKVWLTASEVTGMGGGHTPHWSGEKHLLHWKKVCFPHYIERLCNLSEVFMDKQW